MAPRTSKGWTSFFSGLRDPSNKRLSVLVAVLTWLVDALLCFVIIRRVPYTEIDWVAYMQQAGQFLAGERNYVRIEGATGPVVYPAGHLYVYAALRRLTSGGEILPAQWIFAALYLASLAVILFIYIRSEADKNSFEATRALFMPNACGISAMNNADSTHEKYIYPLFNDGWAMFFAHVALALLTARRFALAILVFSLATSIKMNVLLMAPSVLICVLQGSDLRSTAMGVGLGVGLQIALGYPFLSTFPQEYIGRAFEFSRVFLYQWTVNLKFLPEPFFVSKPLALSLLGAHLALLTTFAMRRWVGPVGFAGLLNAFWARTRAHPDTTYKSDATWTAHVLRTVWTGNFIGVLCARSLHYQFYSWYYFSLPFLLASTSFPDFVQVGMLGIIEVVWNLYPPSRAASLVLMGAHVVLLGGLWYSPQDSFLNLTRVEVQKSRKDAASSMQRFSSRSATKKRE